MSPVYFRFAPWARILLAPTATSGLGSWTPQVPYRSRTASEEAEGRTLAADLRGNLGSCPATQAFVTSHRPHCTRNTKRLFHRRRSPVPHRLVPSSSFGPPRLGHPPEREPHLASTPPAQGVPVRLVLLDIPPPHPGLTDGVVADRPHLPRPFGPERKLVPPSDARSPAARPSAAAPADERLADDELAWPSLP